MQTIGCTCGGGQIVDAAKPLGFDAVGADINKDDPRFVYADLNQKLPFADDEFGVVTSLEGIEHVFYQRDLLKEFVRILEPNGFLIITTPNTANFYSRLKFLFTGTFGPFWPHEMRQRTHEKVDLGHISPISPLELVYAMHLLGAEFVSIHSNRKKRLVYFPLYLLSLPFMGYALWRLVGYQRRSANAFRPKVGLWRLLMGLEGMRSRSLIVVFRKTSDPVI
jgi:SAM-dependent methyltransferase